MMFSAIGISLRVNENSSVRRILSFSTHKYQSKEWNFCLSEIREYSFCVKRQKEELKGIRSSNLQTNLSENILNGVHYIPLDICFRGGRGDEDIFKYGYCSLDNCFG